LETAADILQLLSVTATDTRNGALDCKRANALGYLISIALRTITASDFEQRLEALERLVQQQPRRA
jgi:hypothetical protein